MGCRGGTTASGGPGDGATPDRPSLGPVDTRGVDDAERDSNAPDGSPPSPDAASPDGTAAADSGVAVDGTGDSAAAPFDGPTPSPGIYTGYFYSGGLDHLLVMKWDPERRLCFSLALSAPVTQPGLAVIAPVPWRVTAAGVSDKTSTCTAGLAAPVIGTTATSASGRVDWMNMRPCRIDVDVTLQFANPPSGVPASEILRVPALMVSGAGC